MPVVPLANDDEVFSLPPAELRFRQACQFYVNFKSFHGPEAGLKGNRFLWMCYVDAFVTALVSLKDLTGLRSQLNAISVFRFLVVMRNITAHQAVVSGSSPVSMVARDISVQAGDLNPDRPDHEMPILDAAKIDRALANYEAQLRTQNVHIDQRGRAVSKWDQEQRNVQGALAWNVWLAEQPNGRALLSDVFLETLNATARVSGFRTPPL
jgi:hypothetical protein